jgi:hypothetical protein
MSLVKKIFLSGLILFSASNICSQTKIGAGVLTAVIDGQKDSIGLNISSHNEPNSVYCDVNGGTSQTGMFHFIFENTGSFKDIKPQTLDLSSADSYGKIQWTDFLTLSPYTYKSGKFAITSNDGKKLKGTIEAVASSAGNSMMQLLGRGKSEKTLTNGSFEINYEGK